MRDLESIIREYREADSEKRLYLFLDCPSLRNQFIEIEPTLGHPGEENRFRQQLEQAIRLEAHVVLRASCMMRSGRVIPNVVELGGDDAAEAFYLCKLHLWFPARAGLNPRSIHAAALSSLLFSGHQKAFQKHKRAPRP